MNFRVRVLSGIFLAAAVVGGLSIAGGVGSLMFAGPAVAQSASAIVVQGNRRVDAETIRTYFRTQPGERLDAIKIDEAYRQLLATGLFEDVRISQQAGRIVVTVVEGAVINRVQFEGNRSVKDEQLTAEVQSRPRSAFSRSTVRSDTQRIVDIYRSVGRYDVRVEPKVIELANGRVDLVFEVTEGRKASVKSINFSGNNAFSSGRLKDVVKTGETGIFSFLKSNDIYDADRIEADKNLLRRFYLQRGYADIRISAAVAEFDPERNGFSVTFVVEEGEVYRFGAIDVQSNLSQIDPGILRAKARPNQGAVYDAEAIEKSVEDMTIELAKRGYPFAQVRPRGDRNFETRIIDIAFVVDQGARAYIERINVRGNTRTRDYVIRREFDIAEGDAYNAALVDRAERKLKNLGYFKTAKISSEPGSAPDRVIVNVDVEEQSTGEFSVSGGYSTSDGFIAEVSVGERNLLGNGQYIKAAVQYGQRARGFDFSFVEPYLLGYRIAGGVDLFYKEQLASTFQTYESETIGGALRLGLPITDEISGGIRYSAYQQSISIGRNNNCFPAVPPNAPYFDPADPSFLIANCFPVSPAIRQAVNNGDAFVSLVGYNLTYNTLDNNRNPTKGLIVEFKQDFAGVGGDVNFIRSTVDSRFYYDVTSELIGMLRFQGGHITPWGDQDQLRLLDHFFMGPNLVRGFTVSGIGPRDLTPGSTRDALGGTLYWGTTAELQYPLFFAPKDFGMKAALFADAGWLGNYKGVTSYQGPHDLTAQLICVEPTNPCGDSSSKIRSSVGAGLIWDSPFGPLRFDYAVALTKESFDRTQAFRFSGGTKF